MPNQVQNIQSVDDKTFPYIFEKNVTVFLRNDVELIRLNLYRPKTENKIPIIVTYGPYGKDIPYSE